MGKTYRRIAALAVTEKILKHLADRRDPVPAAELAKTLALPYGTVMSHLATLEDIGWARRVGDHWEVGMGLALYWARRKAYLEGNIARMTTELDQLGAQHDA